MKVSLPLIAQLDKQMDYVKPFTRAVVKTVVDEEVVIVVDILSHFLNNSYRKFKWNRLMKVNGERVINMKQLAQTVHRLVSSDQSAIDDTSFIELDFLTRVQSNERRVAVFDVLEMLASEEEILAKHKIPSWCSPELLF